MQSTNPFFNTVFASQGEFYDKDDYQFTNLEDTNGDGAVNFDDFYLSIEESTNGLLSTSLGEIQVDENSPFFDEAVVYLAYQNNLISEPVILPDGSVSITMGSPESPEYEYTGTGTSILPREDGGYTMPELLTTGFSANLPAIDYTSGNYSLPPILPQIYIAMEQFEERKQELIALTLTLDPENPETRAILRETQRSIRSIDQTITSMQRTADGVFDSEIKKMSETTNMYTTMSSAVNKSLDALSKIRSSLPDVSGA